MIARVSGVLRAASETLTSFAKASVATTTVGFPAAISRVASWRLHDVQDPQFASPTMATS